MYILHCVCPWISKLVFGLLPSLGYVNSAVINIGPTNICLISGFSSFGFLSRTGIVALHGNSVYNF